MKSVIFSALIFLAFSFSERPPSSVDITPDQIQKTPIGINTRLDESLFNISQEAKKSGLSRALSLAGSHHYKTTSSEVRVLITVHSSQNNAVVRDRLSRLRSRIIGEYRNLIDVWIDARDLESVGSIAEIRGAGTHDEPKAHALEGQEVSLMKSKLSKTQGFNGSGIKLAIIDLGFRGLASAQDAGELPMDLTVKSFSLSNESDETPHGTAVAEVVHEMASGASLYLLKVDNSVSLGQAEEYCKNEGVQIINHSVAWFNTSFGDGTGTINDIVNDAYDAGILWVNAAGNEAKCHYSATFNGGSGGTHNFGGGNINQVGYYYAGDEIYGYLCWNDSWSGTANDYDLYLYRWTGSAWTLVFYSNKTQSGTQKPTESISSVISTPGYYGFQVRHYSGALGKKIKLFTSTDLQYSVSTSSIAEPGNGAKTFTVGALDVSKWATGPVESFSSRGPTADGRNKPNLVGADAMTNFTYGNFYGTSAASPSVAGAAAVLLHMKKLSLGELWDSLMSFSTTSNLSGSINDFGAGRLEVVSPILPGKSSLALYGNRLKSTGGAGSGVRLVSRDGGTFQIKVYNSLGFLMADLGTVSFQAGGVWTWDGRVKGTAIPPRLYFLVAQSASDWQSFKFLVE